MSDDGYHAFVSYARDDCEQWALLFIDNLENLGVRVWSRRRIRPGEERDKVVRKALAQSKIFLLIVSPGAILSKDVSHDLDQWGATKPLVPIIVSKYEHPDDRHSGREPIVAVDPKREAVGYRDALVRLATDLLGAPADLTRWSNDLTPEPYPHPVSAELLSRAADVVAFVIKFSAFWNDFARSLDSTHEISPHCAPSAASVALRKKACAYIYRNGCHKSIGVMDRTMAQFREDLESAARLADRIDHGHSERAWWRDVYTQIKRDADAATEEQKIAEERLRRRELAESMAGERRADARAEHEMDEVLAQAEEEPIFCEPSGTSERVERCIPSDMRKDLLRMNTVPHQSVDFLIITALEEERLAVLSKLPGYRKLARDGADTHTYYEAEVKTTRPDGAVYHVVVSSLARVGPIPGALKASAVIKRWHPAHVMMVGIAGGVEGEVALGDVMVAEQVPDYTNGKIHEDGRREERWVSYLADANLFDAASNFPSGWDDLVTVPRPRPGTPKRHVGVIVSGGDVIASKQQIATYLADWPKLIGTEMEGGGVAAGLHTDIERPRFLMIRGVSDLANGQDNAEMKKVWRAHACDVAAAYAIGLLRDGPVPGARVTLPVAPAPASVKASGGAHGGAPTAPLLSRTHVDSPLPPVTVGHDLAEIAGLLSRLVDSQFGDVVLRLRIEDAYLPPQSAPMATRAQALVLRMDQEGADGVRRLVTAIQSVAPHLPWRPAASINAAPGAVPAPTSVPVASMTSAAVLVATTPTWKEFDALPRRYEVNPFDDIVLCMHPDCEREWRTIVPNARMGVQCVTIRTPAGLWHRAGAPTLSIWKDVFQQISAKVQEVRAAKQSRLHLVAKAPLALGALLGRLIDPHDQLLVYQLDTDHGNKVWRPWGPAWPADPGTRGTPFFDVPPGLEQCRPEQDGHFALVVDVSGNNNADTCVEAVKTWAGGRNVQPLLIRANDITGQDAVRVPADVDKAAIELDRVFQQIAEALPNATLHVFYYGPLGILIRACRRLWLRRTPIIFWDTYYDSAARYFPAIAFPEGRLLIGDGAP
ncbi:SAVED domain-containing protein [Sorangium sp. So ce590]|uniref:SAVED domain-containing protein n=1 Tax=Sorangium sp. So ce590 TaxID=3133317 RepID=UPI003F5F9609